MVLNKRKDLGNILVTRQRVYTFLPLYFSVLFFLLACLFVLFCLEVIKWKTLSRSDFVLVINKIKTSCKGSVNLLPIGTPIFFTFSHIAEEVLMNLFCYCGFFPVVELMELVKKHEILLYKLSLTMYFSFVWQL